MVVASPPPPISLSAIFGLILVRLLFRDFFASPLFLDVESFAEILFASPMNEVWELALSAELMKSGKRKDQKGQGGRMKRNAG